MTFDGMIEEFARREAQAWSRIAATMEMRVSPAPGATVGEVCDQVLATLRETGGVMPEPKTKKAEQELQAYNARICEAANACLCAVKQAAENGNGAAAEAFARAAKILMCDLPG